MSKLKSEKLEENGISVGEAIDILFKIKDEALQQMDRVDENINLLTQITTSRDADKKIDILEKTYGDSDKNYEMKIKDVKQKLVGVEISLNFKKSSNLIVF